MADENFKEEVLDKIRFQYNKLNVEQANQLYLLKLFLNKSKESYIILKDRLPNKLQTKLKFLVGKRSATCLKQSTCDKKFIKLTNEEMETIKTLNTGIPISAWGIDTSNYANKLSMKTEKNIVKDLLKKLENVEQTMRSTKPAQDISDVTESIAVLKSSVEKMEKEINPLKLEVEELRKKKNQHDTLLEKLKNVKN